MAPRHKGRFWRKCRIYFRRIRITVWLMVLALLSALLYVNQIGLPGFVKKPLLENLRARGLDLQFSRLRWSWQRGVVAENVQFGQADTPFSPQLTAAQVCIKFNHSALARFRFQIDGVVLRQGRLIWPVEETNRVPRRLMVAGIQTEVRFLPEDKWSLDEFRAGFAGARIQLSGTVTHASAIREWRFLKPREAAPVGRWKDQLRGLADLLERIKFSRPPNLQLDIRGDARDLASFGARLLLSTSGADTPWGTVSQGWLSARLYPADTNGLSSGQLTLEAAEARTRWGAARQLQASAHVFSFDSMTMLGNGNLSVTARDAQTDWGQAANLRFRLQGAAMAGQTNLINAELDLRGNQIRTKWGSATNLEFRAAWIHSLTNIIPFSGHGRLRCDQLTTEWAAAREAKLAVYLAPSTAPPRAGASWAWWGRLEPYVLGWESQVAGLQSHGVGVEQVDCGGTWQAPLLTITNLQATVGQRPLDAQTTVDVATRALALSLASDIDPHRLAPVLSKETRDHLKDCSWAQPPHLKAEASLILPPWTNRPPDWRTELQRTVQLQADLKIEQGAAYRQLAISTAQSRFSYSNLVLRVAELSVTRPEGRLDVVGETDTRTRDFCARVSSTVDVTAIRPLLDKSVQRAFELFSLTQPPVVEAEARGRFGAVERLGVSGRVAVTNFIFREQSFSGLQTAVQYSNRFLQFVAPRVQRGAEQMGADGLTADFATQLIFLTNGVSTGEPMVIASAIGAHVARAVENYQFKQPPHARVHGTIPMHGEEGADLHFDLEGGPFEWWHFRMPYVSGHVHWLGEHLTLTNMWMQFYGGEAHGEAQFDFHPGQDTDYRFTVAMTNSLLHPLVEDVFVKTNTLEGRVTGTLVVSRANTSTIKSWEGHGDLTLQDGFIWDIPLFGVFSSVLNSMKPGLGSSRASAGACTFTITNGIIRTEDLDIRSTGMRLQYRGTLDFEGQVNARVEAEALRDTWLVGPLVSTMLWPVTKLFEYKVTGSLEDPKAEPVRFIPKLMLLPFQMPFHPWRSLKGLFPESESSGTNAPPPTPQN